jgi:hypothetical protein
MRWPGSYWEAPYHPARPFWLARGTYLLLALDVLLLMVEHGGRYGVGGFNVAHFSWLDGLLGVPSPAQYLGLLMLSALLALCAALGAMPRAFGAALLAAYTLAWAWSQHDSYQHHYFLSWVLAWLLWLPRPRAADCLETTARTSGPGLGLVATTCAIVYSFTALSKSEAAWQSGAVLRHLARTPGPFAWIVQVGQPLLGELALRVAALGVLLLQVVVACAYWVAPLRDAAEDEPTARVLGTACSVGWCGALVFHLVTELDSGFSIGWFSYYMLWISAVVFAPSAWLAALTRVLAPVGRWTMRLGGSRVLCYAALACASAVLLWLVRELDLPGMGVAATCVGLSYAAVALCCLRRSDLRTATRYAMAIALSLAASVLLLSLSEVRFDYYRRAAGELRRMGLMQASLALYRKADRYAPRGINRQDVIEQLERQVSEQRSE